MAAEKIAIRFLCAEASRLWKDAGIENPPNAQIWAKKFAKQRVAVKAKPPSETRPPEIASIEQVREWLGDCTRCGLCHTRKQIVFGEGSPNATIMFVGEGPGTEEDDDANARPLVGKAGELLTKIIEAMGKKREEVYLANTIKCRPPENRAPLPEEVNTCSPFLKAQIDLIQPQVIVALGNTATKILLGVDNFASLRGKWQKLPGSSSISVMPTYHPSYLLKTPTAKKIVWDDMKLVLKKVGN